MIDSEDKRRLLDHVLAEGEPTGFRDAALTEMLRGARRKRRRRTVGKIGIVAFALGLTWITLSTGRRFSPKSLLREVAKVTPARMVADHRIRVVETASFDRGAIVHSQPLMAGQFVTSLKLVDKVASSTRAQIVSTKGFGRSFLEISDRQLLTLISPHPAALFRDSREIERLVFVNAGDEHGFPID